MLSRPAPPAQLSGALARSVARRVSLRGGEPDRAPPKSGRGSGGRTNRRGRDLVGHAAVFVGANGARVSTGSGTGDGGGFRPVGSKPVERDGSTSWRAVVVTLAVTGAILTVAVTAGSVRGSLPTDTLQIGLSQPADLIRGLLFALYIGLLAHAFYLWLLDRDAPKRKGAGSRQRSPLIPLLALVGLVAVRVLFRDFWDRLTTVAPGTPM